MAFVKSRLFVALDARSVCVAEVRGALARRRLEQFVRLPLAPGALSPSPSGANLQRPEEVRETLRQALDAVGRPLAGATLVLPDGVGRLALLPLPADADAREFVRFRLASSLPYPSAEAIVDVMPVGNGQVIGAALRRGAVAEYEQAMTALGLAVERVHLAPLVALGALLRAGAGQLVGVILGESAACFAVMRAGTLVALGNRRRDTSTGEGPRLRQEAERMAGLTANGDGPYAVVLSGADAAQLRAEAGIADAGPRLPDLQLWPGAVDAAWLRGVVS